MKMKSIAVALLVIGLAAGTVIPAGAQGYGGPGMGPGYGRNYGGGPGYGAGAGYGPGYGPGMMGGRGGPGWGTGPSGGGLSGLSNLTEDQIEKISQVQEENRRKNWETMGQMRSEQFKLRQMLYGDKLDANAVADQQKKVDELRRQMLKSRIEARNQVAALLTKEQQQQFRRFGPWWMEEGE